MTSSTPWPADPTAAGPAAPLPPDLVLGVDHVGIATADLDLAVAFYTRRLGLQELRREHIADQRVVEVMLGAGRTVGALPAVGPAVPVTQLQLLAATSPDSAVARFLDRSGPGLQHLAFRVADLDRVAAHLRATGVRLLYPRPARGSAGSLINFLHPRDTGGVLVELVRPAAVDTRAQPQIPHPAQ